MIAIIDYGIGNLRSVSKALEHIGLEVVITSNPNEIEKSDGIILPGVGAFPRAMQELEERGLIDVLKREVANGKPLLGICLGMQLLFTSSEEIDYTEGLNFIPGHMTKLVDTEKIPHMGWNSLTISQETPLLANVPNDSYVYYVHSFYAKCDEEYINAWSPYSVKVPGVVSHKNVYGAQFHPEKSGDVGLQILRNFKEVVQSCLSSQQSI